MSKLLEARYTIDIIAVVEIEDVKDELANARTIEKAQQSCLYPLRRELEKKMVELSRDDIKFKLRDSL
jgi:hypothetical protein